MLGYSKGFVSKTYRYRLWTIIQHVRLRHICLTQLTFSTEFIAQLQIASDTAPDAENDGTITRPKHYTA